MLNENVQNNDLTNTAILSISQIDTENKTNQLLVINNQGQVEWNPPTNLEIEVQQIQPSEIQNDILVTNQSGQIAWQKVQNANIQNLAITNSKINDVDFNKVQNVSISESMLQNDSVSNSKIQNNSIDVSKIAHPDISGKVLLSQINTDPKWDFIDSENLAANCVNDSKIADVNFNKITNTENQISQIMMQDASVGNAELIDLCVSNSKIQNATIQQEKIVQTQSRRYFVDYVNGIDAIGRGYSQQYAWKTLQYAVDNCQDYSCIEICDKSVTGNFVIQNKQYLTIMSNQGLTNSTQCVLYTQSLPFTIGNSCNSIKFKGVQFDTSSKSYNTIQIDSGNHYFESCSFSTNALYNSCVFGSSCSYVQFKSCQFQRPISFYQQPTQASIILLYENCDVHSIANSYSGANFIVKDANINQQVLCTNGSFLSYQTQFQAGISFTSASPNILFLQTANSFNSTTFQDQTISQTNATALYYISNNSIYKSNSVFSGIRIFPKFTTNSDIQDHTISAQKLQALTANRFVSTDSSGYISTKQYVENADLQTNTISLNKLQNGTNGKTLVYSNGVLTETDFPSSVSDYSQLTNTQENTGFIRLNGASSTTYQTQIQNDDIAGISYTKINTDIAQANKFLKFDLNGNISTETQSSTVDFANIENWPQSFGTANLVFADGSNNKISLNSFNSGNDYLVDIVAGKPYVYWFKNIAFGQDIITQNQFRTFEDILTADIPNKIIPGSKLQNDDLLGLGSALYMSIAGSWKLAYLTRNLFTTFSNSLPIIGPEHILFQNSPTENYLVAYDATNQKFKYVAGQADTNLTWANFYIGDFSGTRQTVNLANDAKWLDQAYYSHNNVGLDVPLYHVLTTNNATNTCKWNKLVPNNMYVNSTPSSNNRQFLCYDTDTSFNWKRIQDIDLDYSISQLETGYRLKWSMNNTAQTNTQKTNSMIRFQDAQNENTHISFRYGQVDLQNNTINVINQSWWAQINSTVNSLMQASIQFGEDGFVVRSPFSNSVLQFWSDQSNSSYTTQMSRLYQGQTAIQVFSDENKKSLIQQQSEQDQDYCLQVVQQNPIISYRYNVYDQDVEKHKNRVCDCQNTDSCNKKLAELIHKKNKKYYGFSYQNISATQLKSITNSYESNHYNTEIQQERNTLLQDQQTAFDAYKNIQLQDEENCKMLASGQLITVLWSALQSQQRKIDNILTRLQNAGIQ